MRGPRRPPAVSAGAFQRAHAIEIDGDLLVIECDRCGTRFGMYTPRIEFYLRYWGRPGSGCASFCRKCDPREWRASQRRAVRHPGRTPDVIIRAGSRRPNQKEES